MNESAERAPSREDTDGKLGYWIDVTIKSKATVRDRRRVQAKPSIVSQS